MRWGSAAWRAACSIAHVRSVFIRAATLLGLSASMIASGTSGSSDLGVGVVGSVAGLMQGLVRAGTADPACSSSRNSARGRNAGPAAHHLEKACDSVVCAYLICA